MGAIEQRVLEILSRGEVDGNVFRITAGQLDRKLYQDVNRVLETLGGKWNRRVRGHVFESDPTDPLDRVITVGEIGPANPLEFFETPADLADRMAKLAELDSGQAVLEPSAGHGALVMAMRRAGFQGNVAAIELDPARAAVVGRIAGVSVRNIDFLEFEPTAPFDRILMNPPFSRGQDVAHISRACSMLAPEGILVAIAGAGVSFRQERKYREFRQLVESRGYMAANPEGSFKGSGTAVRTVTLVMRGAGEGRQP